MKSNIRTFVYLVVLWDETGNILKEKYEMKVRRVNQSSALNTVKRKYPFPYFVELNSIK